MRKNSSLEISILGLLSNGPLHGYELRKKITHNLGLIRYVSFGALYPELKRLSSLEFIEEKETETEKGLMKRSRISYQLTSKGKDRLSYLLDTSGPEAWEDDAFTTYFSFFAKMASNARIQILQGRKVRLQEKINLFQDQLNITDQKLDTYNLQLKNYNIDSVRREIKWIDELILSERKEL